MKQIIQNFRTGDTVLEDVPAPRPSQGQVLIQTSRSLVSLGTERMLVEFGKANLIQKARQQPDKVKMVLDKIKAEGLLPTLESVFSRLEQPLPLGYCNVGQVIDVADDVSDFKVGDRVASNGPHAEIVSVPQNLVAHIPENVSDEAATFTVIGSIGLQGIRLLQPTLGEHMVVFGLGLIGLISAQLLQAHGCQVIGLDVDDNKIELAKSLGIVAHNPNESDPVAFVQSGTRGIGADGVLITASAKTDSIISQSARMSRKRGRLVLVGVTGLNLNRAEFYEKELTFQVSCSYGPGRYDHQYEQQGRDYPLSYVRWTEKRNFEAVLQAIAGKKIDVEHLISEIVELDNFQSIYGDMRKGSIASILKYPQELVSSRSTIIATVGEQNSASESSGHLGIIGAGNFTKMTLLPALDTSKVKSIASAGGLNAKALAKKHGIHECTSDYREVLDDPGIDAVIITTRHNLHAEMINEALLAGKHVFVEKPLCLNRDELKQIKTTYFASQKGINSPSLTVGFNRRFSPHIEKIKKSLPESSPKNLIATMNAGKIPDDVWVHDPNIGGGRIVGEACHLIDLLSFLSGSLVVAVCMNALGRHPERTTDSASIQLKFANGDHGVVHYFANGSKAYSKERLEIYFDEKTIILDNFRTTIGYGVKDLSKFKSRLDKGHQNQFRQFQDALTQGGKPLISTQEIFNVSEASFAAIESLQLNKWVEIRDEA